MMMRTIGLACVTAVGIVIGAALCREPTPPANPPSAEPRLRRPVSLQLLDAGRRLLVANRDSGSLQLVNATDRSVTTEIRIGIRLAQAIAFDHDARILAIDESSGELVIVARDGDTLRETGRRRVGLSPVGVSVTEDGRRAIVACLWPRQLRLVPLDTKGIAADASITAIDLPFAPRRSLVIPGTNKAIVGDAFGGQLAIVDLPSRSVDVIPSLGAQNIRGLAFDPSRRHLVLAQQFLNPTAATRKEEIQNGNVLNNQVRRLSLANVLGSPTNDAATDQVFSIGDIEQGAGDPAEIAVDRQGRVIVALAGVNEIAIGQLDDVIWTRLPVGRRPTALTYDDAQKIAYVANTFDDSISIVDCQSAKTLGTIPLGPPPPELRSEQRGELLFHDARRSHDAWMSCQSCHPDGHTTGRLNDNFSDGSFGTPKRILSLLGAKETGPWAWRGSVANLEDQVRNSFVSTMRGPAPSDAEVRDVTAYLRTLQPPPSLFDARGDGDVASRERGSLVFAKLQCVRCHQPPLFTTPKTYDVGMSDTKERFNPPSLRGISQGGPYFHDNRAVSLAEILSRVRHQIEEPLTPRDRDDLEAYLKSL